jgi:hypothetical protein
MHNQLASTGKIMITFHLTSNERPALSKDQLPTLQDIGSVPE